MSYIPAQPYDYPLPKSLQQLALVIIDMQRDFVEPGGFGAALGNTVEPLQAIIPVVGQLLQRFRELELPVIHTLECHQADLSDCPPSKLQRGQALLGENSLKIGDRGPMGRILIQGEPGNAIVPALTPLAGEIVIHKPGKGAFYGTDLAAQLRDRQITHLLMTGVTTEVCVQTTMREANDRGYECLLVADATASYFPAFKQATLEMVTAQGGIIGWVSSVATVLASLPG
ncbi:MAG: cysteine hydrolase [Cyanobacteria bacterium P01_H01_bin.121]